MEAHKQYPVWTLIDWDGNPALGYKCWRKTFGRGHISVGVGDFLLVAFSFGANSDDSYSLTRWNYNRPVITEAEAMETIDKYKKMTHKAPADWPKS